VSRKSPDHKKNIAPSALIKSCFDKKRFSPPGLKIPKKNNFKSLNTSAATESSDNLKLDTIDGLAKEIDLSPVKESNMQRYLKAGSSAGKARRISQAKSPPRFSVFLKTVDTTTSSNFRSNGNMSSVTSVRRTREERARMKNEETSDLTKKPA